MAKESKEKSEYLALIKEGNNGINVLANFEHKELGNNEKRNVIDNYIQQLRNIQEQSYKKELAFYQLIGMKDQPVRNDLTGYFRWLGTNINKMSNFYYFYLENSELFKGSEENAKALLYFKGLFEAMSNYQFYQELYVNLVKNNFDIVYEKKGSSLLYTNLLKINLLKNIIQNSYADLKKNGELSQDKLLDKIISGCEKQINEISSKKKNEWSDLSQDEQAFLKFISKKAFGNEDSWNKKIKNNSQKLSEQTKQKTRTDLTERMSIIFNLFMTEETIKIFTQQKDKNEEVILKSIKEREIEDITNFTRKKSFTDFFQGIIDEIFEELKKKKINSLDDVQITWNLDRRNSFKPSEQFKTGFLDVAYNFYTPKEIMQSIIKKTESGEIKNEKIEIEGIKEIAEKIDQGKIIKVKDKNIYYYPLEDKDYDEINGEIKERCEEAGEKLLQLLDYSYQQKINNKYHEIGNNINPNDFLNEILENDIKKSPIYKIKDNFKNTLYEYACDYFFSGKRIRVFKENNDLDGSEITKEKKIIFISWSKFANNLFSGKQDYNIKGNFAELLQTAILKTYGKQFSSFMGGKYLNELGQSSHADIISEIKTKNGNIQIGFQAKMKTYSTPESTNNFYGEEKKYNIFGNSINRYVKDSKNSENDALYEIRLISLLKQKQKENELCNFLTNYISNFYRITDIYGIDGLMNNFFIVNYKMIPVSLILEIMIQEAIEEKEKIILWDLSEYYYETGSIYIKKGGDYNKPEDIDNTVLKKPEINLYIGDKKEPYKRYLWAKGIDISETKINKFFDREKKFIEFKNVLEQINY